MTDFVSITIVIVIIFMVFRWLSATGDNSQTNRQGQNRGRIPSRPQARLVNPEMVETVRAMFPHIPTAAIHYDLQKTGSVEQTCDNILRDGSLPMPPAPRPATPPTPSPSNSGAGSSSGASHSVNGNLVQRFKLQSAVEQNIVPEEPSKVWGDSAEKRQEVFKNRKEFMVLQARKRFLEEEARKAKEAAEKAEVETSA
ncbi:coupling of ubiquitin conjugation to ER degradation protein 1 [Entomortierella parvispora]|uniref:Coupling of ubiquitin conjugation to ER degradation protein 1 n=1 Tax=Entomortierella parvispora TaxID=205924 RepID=A0A9P3H2F2_9FUNG|nr:coupling of ubiquitin conjugation to ER degradation protein 1 [Entomortierella parvispora]